MLISKNAIIAWGNINQKRLIEKGYKFTKMHDKLLVSVEDLSKGSHALIAYKCDNCGKIVVVEWKAYLKNHNHLGFDVCRECRYEKSKITNMDLHGVENISQREEVKRKKIETCRQHYGTDHPLQSSEVKQRVLKTNREKYGCDYSAQNEEVKQKMKNTCLKRYGYENTLQSPEVRSKIFKTNKQRYGHISPLGNQEVRNKAKQTCIKNLGVENPFRSDEVLKKCRETLYKNGNCPTSKQQLSIYNMLKCKYEFCELNYPVSKCMLDCVINVNDSKIDIEYDGQYWHQDKQKDRRRDEFLKSQGYKILRIKGGHKTPTEQQLQDAIDYLVKDNHSYAEIILDI